MGLTETKEVSKKLNTSTHKNGLLLRVVTDEQSFDELEDEWEHLTNEIDCHIFQTFHWNRIWWKYFGSNGTLRIILFYDGRKLIGISPLFLDTVHLLGKQVYTCLRFIGSNITRFGKKDLIGLISYTDYLGFIIKPEFEQQVYHQFVRYVDSLSQKPDEIILDSVAERNAEAGLFLQLVRNAGWQTDTETTNKSFRVFLASDWEAYLASVSKDTRSHTRRALKKLFEDDQRIYSIEKPVNLREAEKLFDEMVQLHQQRWNRLGYPGTFSERVNHLFQKEVALQLFENGRLQVRKLVSIYENSRAAAIDINYKYKNKLYGAHCSVDDTSAYYKKGPGTVLLSVTLKEMVDTGLICFDFLRGTESYKQAYANDSDDIIRITIRLHGARRAAAVKRCMILIRKLSRELAHIRQLDSGTVTASGLWAYTELFIQRITRKFHGR